MHSMDTRIMQASIEMNLLIDLIFVKFITTSFIFCDICSLKVGLQSIYSPKYMNTLLIWMRSPSALKGMVVSILFSCCLELNCMCSVDVGFSFCLIFFQSELCSIFSKTEYFFLSKKRFCQFNKHGFLMSEENVIFANINT